MATTSWPILSPSELPIVGDREVGLVDLDDGEVGQRVDAVDAALELAAVLELDLVSWSRALDDVAVGEDPAVRVVDHAGADAGRGDRRRTGRVAGCRWS